MFVLVPLKSEQKYSTFTVRIHSEYIGDIVPTKPRTKRILIVIWPFFTVRSLMPMDLSVQDKHFQKAYTTDGRGGCTDLQIAGTFDTEHEFSLDLGLVLFQIVHSFLFFHFNCIVFSSSSPFYLL